MTAGARAGTGDQHAAMLSSDRWVMIGLVFLAAVINYLDRQSLSVAVPVIIEQFHLSSVEYFRIIPIFGFMLAYTAINGISGSIML